jgi:hypothetical protein
MYPPFDIYAYYFSLLYFIYLILQNRTYVPDTGYQWAPLHVRICVGMHVCMYVCGRVTIRLCFEMDGLTFIELN